MEGEGRGQGECDVEKTLKIGGILWRHVTIAFDIPREACELNLRRKGRWRRRGGAR